MNVFTSLSSSAPNFAKMYRITLTFLSLGKSEAFLATNTYGMKVRPLLRHPVSLVIRLFAFFTFPIVIDVVFENRVLHHI